MVKETREIHHIEPDNLDTCLGSWLMSLQRPNGDDYEPSTITSIHRGIDRSAFNMNILENNFQHSLKNDSCSIQTN